MNEDLEERTQNAFGALRGMFNIGTTIARYVIPGSLVAGAIYSATQKDFQTASVVSMMALYSYAAVRKN